MVSQRTIWKNGDRIYEIKTNINNYTYIQLDQEFNPITGDRKDIFTIDKAPKIYFGNKGEQIIYSPMGETGEIAQEGGKLRKKRKHKKKSLRKHKRKSVRKHKRKSTRKRRRTTTKHDY